MLDHVFSVFTLPALCCHNCTSPPVKEAHSGMGICATSRFILVSLKPLLNLQQHLSLENTCWAQRWELYPKNALCHLNQIFLSELSLEALRLKRNCLSYSRPLISYLFPKKMDPLWKRKWRRTFANQLSTLHHKEWESKTSNCPIWVGKICMQLLGIFDFSPVLSWT